MMNSDKYLLVKQGICIFQAMLLNCAVTVNDNQLELKKYGQGLMDELSALQQDMTIPTAIFERPIHMSLMIDMVDSIRRLLEKELPLDPGVMDLNDIRKLVHVMPDFQTFNKVLTEGNPHEDSTQNHKQVAAKLVEKTEELLERLIASVNSAITENNTELIFNVDRSLRYVNAIHVVDFFFDYTNDKFGA